MSESAPALPAIIESIEFESIATRALAAASPMTDRLRFARTFASQLVSAWWSELTISDTRPMPLRAPMQPFDVADLPADAAEVAKSIGRAAVRLNPEAAAYLIGVAYTTLLPPEHRSALGIFYTPPILTKRLISQATNAGTDWAAARVLDPACGGGAFLTPVAQRIMEALPGCSPAILLQNIGTRLRGFDIDPFGAWLSQVSLDAVLLPLSRAANRRLPVIVTVCDSLRRNPPRERFDLVIGNPPYGRTSLSAIDRARFRRSLYGHANLYGLFTDIALRFAKTDGVIAYVTPTSFLAGEYFKNLRATLGQNASPVAVDFVARRKGVFDNVLQETLLATYRCGATRRPIAVHELVMNGVASLRAVSAGVIELPVEPSQPWLLPRDPKQVQLVSRLATMADRLVDWGYTVSTGPLVWNRFKDQLVHQQGPNRLPLIWAESVTAEGRFVFRAVKRNHAPYFELRARDSWLVVDEPCVLLQRTTAKEQARRLIAACLSADFLKRHGGSVVVENHLNMLKPTSSSPIVPQDVLAVFLNSAAADRAFRCVSGSVAVSAYELESLPLPPPQKLAPLCRLVRLGEDRKRIEAECTRLFK